MSNAMPYCTSKTYSSPKSRFSFQIICGRGRGSRIIEPVSKRLIAPTSMQSLAILPLSPCRVCPASRRDPYGRGCETCARCSNPAHAQSAGEKHKGPAKRRRATVLVKGTTYLNAEQIEPLRHCHADASKRIVVREAALLERRAVQVETCSAIP